MIPAALLSTIYLSSSSLCMGEAGVRSQLRVRSTPVPAEYSVPVVAVAVADQRLLPFSGRMTALFVALRASFRAATRSRLELAAEILDSDTSQHMDIEGVLTAPRSPWQNPFVERVIGSIRRECLDHVIVVNESHLRRVLTSYLRYYHRSRTHLGLEKDTPDRRPVAETSFAPTIAMPEVGGLHHRYDRIAA